MVKRWGKEQSMILDMTSNTLQTLGILRKSKEQLVKHYTLVARMFCDHKAEPHNKHSDFPH